MPKRPPFPESHSVMRTRPAVMLMRVCVCSVIAFGVAGSFAEWTSWRFAVAGGFIGLLSVAGVVVAEVFRSRFPGTLGLLAGVVAAFTLAAWSVRHDQDGADAILGRTVMGTALSGLCLLLLALFAHVAVARRGGGGRVSRPKP